MMLLQTSSRKNTRWLFSGDEKRNKGVEKASMRYSSLEAATIDRLFRYGETEKREKQDVSHKGATLHNTVII